MSVAFTDNDDSIAVLEDYRATISELRGNLERLKELVEEQILLETPPRYRHRQQSRSHQPVFSSHSE
jgi:uncharacterized metal-binding protein YceD (DUF177 family)